MSLSGYASQLSPLTLPGTLWNCYFQYLWNYTPNSWVATVAYSCRLLAILVSLPTVVLALLDIASYGIARTLGVIDDVKASTSDKATIHEKQSTPSILVHTPQSDSSSLFADMDREFSPLSPVDVVHPHAYFTSEDNNLKLSGVGVFSPATSQPPSPTISRRNLHLEGARSFALEGDASGQEEGMYFRQRGKQATDNKVTIDE